MRLRNIRAKFVVKSLHINGIWKATKSFILVKKCSNVQVAHHRFSGEVSNLYLPDGSLSHSNKGSERVANQILSISLKPASDKRTWTNMKRFIKNAKKLFSVNFVKLDFSRRVIWKYMNKGRVIIETSDLHCNKWSNFDTVKSATLFYWPRIVPHSYIHRPWQLRSVRFRYYNIARNIYI